MQIKVQALAHRKEPVKQVVSSGTPWANRLNVLHNKVLRAITYSSYKSRVSPLYKKVNLKINDIYIPEIGKFMHRLYPGEDCQFRSMVYFC